MNKIQPTKENINAFIEKHADKSLKERTRVKIDPSYMRNSDDTPIEGDFEIFRMRPCRGGYFYKYIKRGSLRGESSPWLHAEAFVVTHGHPILIGDVLDLAGIAWTEEQQKEQQLGLVELWHECGTTKSLQSIASEIVWKDAYIHPDDGTDCVMPCDEEDPCGYCERTKVIKLPAKESQRDFWSLLLNLGL